MKEHFLFFVTVKDNFFANNLKNHWKNVSNWIFEILFFFVDVGYVHRDFDILQFKTIAENWVSTGKSFSEAHNICRKCFVPKLF